MNFSTHEFLRRHRQRARGALLLWTAVTTIAAVAVVAAGRIGWRVSSPSLILSMNAAALALLAAWFKRTHGLTTHRLARKLDQRWELRSRLETSVELAGNDAPFAIAQRENASRALTGRKVPGAFVWRLGQLALLSLAALIAIEGIVWAVQVGKSTVAAAKPKPGAVDSVNATIEWVSPDPEIKATAIEEVPLTATADSNTGLRSLALEIVINGERETTQKLDGALPTTAVQPGVIELTPSLFLDELHVKPYDIVSYRLVAELNTTGPKRQVRSPPQLVEIRPPQKDAALQGNASEFPAFIYELKSRQLSLLKQNAALAHLSLAAPDDPSWEPENARVSNEQQQLAGRTNEVLSWVKTQKPGAPALITDNLSGAAEQMTRASKEIAAKANDPATRPQNRALALITELEQFITQALAAAGPAAVDPIRDEQNFQLPSRAATPAGELEQLAVRQEKLNATLNGEQAANSSGGPLAASEAGIATDAQQLARTTSLETDVQKAITAAAVSAKEAARQLESGDPTAARVPAAAAEESLKEAVQLQDKAGRAIAVAQLEQVRRQLNQAVRASPTTRATQLASAGKALREAALQQQRNGSAEAARELAQLAKLISAPRQISAAVAQTAPNSAERAQEVAVAAARAQVMLSARGPAVTRVVRQLQRFSQGPANGAALAASADSLGTLELVSQEAAWISTDVAIIEQARLLAGRTDTVQRGAIDAAIQRELAEKATQLARTIELGREASAADLIRRFNPADVDPAYREAVESYFERLSRDTRRLGPPGATP